VVGYQLIKSTATVPITVNTNKENTMIEGTSMFNQQHYARLETLITDDAQLMELASVAPDDDFVMELLWNAQMGNTDYPFESASNPCEAGATILIDT
jgi:hypothetical protein